MRELFLIMSLCVLATACTANKQDTVQSLSGPISYLYTPADGQMASQGDTEPFTVCDLVENADSVVIAQINEVNRLERRRDCAGDYVSPVDIYTVETLALIAGERVPTTIDVYAINGGNLERRPVAGQDWLLALRSYEGDQILVSFSQVHLGPPEEGDMGRREHNQLPTTFEELVDQSEKRLNALARECPDHRRAPEEQLDKIKSDPDYYGYSCDDTPHGPPGDEDPHSEECTDEFPCN